MEIVNNFYYKYMICFKKKKKLNFKCKVKLGKDINYVGNLYFWCNMWDVLGMKEFFWFNVGIVIY